MHSLTQAVSLPFSEVNFVWALVIAAVLGACFGLERSIAGKHAGMRTYALVSLGSCLFVIIGTLSSLQLSFFSGINPVQIAGSIVIGIGFIGAGLSGLRGGRNTRRAHHRNRHLGRRRRGHGLRIRPLSAGDCRNGPRAYHLLPLSQARERHPRQIRDA